MLKVWGKIIKNGKLIKSETFTSGKAALEEAMLEALEYFGKVFDIEVPMWQSNHTVELVAFRRIIFREDDFIDKINFDRFEIEVLERDN